MAYGFGVDIGGTTVKLAFFSQDGTLLQKWEIPTVTRDGGKAILPDIAASVAGYLERERIDRSEILGIGVGVPGPVSAEGVVNRCANLGWGVTDLRTQLSELTGLPVQVGNDANVAALGECRLGGGRGCRNMVMVTLGTGVGGGIIVDGKILHGSHSAGGEIGHITLEPTETEPCGCGKFGCAEQYCSATGVVRLAKRYLAAHEIESILRRENLTCKDVFAGAEAGDPAALAVTEQVYDYLGRLMASIACVTDPEIFVIGGGVSRAGKPLLEGAARYFKKYAFHASRETPIAAATLGNDAGVYGAFQLII